MPRAVIDTSVRVSALLTPNGYPGRVLAAAFAGRFTVLVSEPLLAELATVINRPRIRARLGIDAKVAQDLVAVVRRQAEMVELLGDVRLCRDPDDDMVIETALRGGADVLVTRDDDLKGASDVVDVLRARGVAVLSVQRFLDLLDADDDAVVGSESS